ncbi:MAG: hypothetical protein H6581_20335 [Bacteroidia bacterium]|nr:hypothetical protein [Bacteroidia bacterium]
MKEFGFGPRIYSSKQFGDSFFPLLRMYSESGIPLIVAVQNEKIGHAFLCIGREKISGNMIDSLEPGTESDLLVKRILDEGKITLLDFSEISCQFIFIDDNRPVYQKARLETPTINYPSPTWKDCQISYFIAPLYPKIYLEAFEAKKYFKQFFFRIFRDSIPIESEIMIRFFLTSSRSFKHSVNFNVSMGGEMKSIILETSMPKFIWVGEISNRGLIKSNKANGVVILDATEANILDNKPLILGAFQDKIVTFEFPGRTLTTMEIPFPAFEIYSNYSGDY